MGPLEVTALPGFLQHLAARHGTGSWELPSQPSRVSLALYREAACRTEIPDDGHVSFCAALILAADG